MNIVATTTTRNGTQFLRNKFIRYFHFSDLFVSASRCSDAHNLPLCISIQILWAEKTWIKLRLFCELQARHFGRNRFKYEWIAFNATAALAFECCSVHARKMEISLLSLVKVKVKSSSAVSLNLMPNKTKLHSMCAQTHEMASMACTNQNSIQLASMKILFIFYLPRAKCQRAPGSANTSTNCWILHALVAQCKCLNGKVYSFLPACTYLSQASLNPFASNYVCFEIRKKAYIK